MAGVPDGGFLLVADPVRRAATRACVVSARRLAAAWVARMRRASTSGIPAASAASRKRSHCGSWNGCWLGKVLVPRAGSGARFSGRSFALTRHGAKRRPLPGRQGLGAAAVRVRRGAAVGESVGRAGVGLEHAVGAEGAQGRAGVARRCRKDQAELSAAGGHLAACGDQDREAAGVAEVQTAQVDDELSAAVPDQPEQPLAEGGDSGEVEGPADVDQGPSVALAVGDVRGAQGGAFRRLWPAPDAAGAPATGVWEVDRRADSVFDGRRAGQPPVSEADSGGRRQAWRTWRRPSAGAPSRGRGRCPGEGVVPRSGRRDSRSRTRWPCPARWTPTRPLHYAKKSDDAPVLGVKGGVRGLWQPLGAPGVDLLVGSAGACGGSAGQPVPSRLASYFVGD